MPDLWFYGILNFLKKGRGSCIFRKIRATLERRLLELLGGVSRKSDKVI